MLPLGAASPALPLLQQQRQNIIAQVRAVKRELGSLFYVVLNTIIIFHNSLPMNQEELTGAAVRGPEGQ